MKKHEENSKKYLAKPRHQHELCAIGKHGSWLETLSVAPRPSGGGQRPNQLPDEKKDEVLAAFTEKGGSTLRCVGEFCQQNPEQREMFPWKYQSVQELLPDDDKKRLKFCK